MKAEMQNILDHEVDKLKKQLTRSDDPLSIRRTLGNKEPVQILVDVFELFRKNFSGMQHNKISDFLQCVTRDPRMRRLFLLSIYEGAYGLPIDKLVADEHAPQKQSVTSDRLDFFNQPEGKSMWCFLLYHQKSALSCFWNSCPLLSLMFSSVQTGLVLAQVCEHLMCAPFPIDLASLARLERNVVEHFSAPAFHSLGHLSFLQFLAVHDEAIQALGGSVIGGHSSTTAHQRTVKDKALGVISQLKPTHREDEV